MHAWPTTHVLDRGLTLHTLGFSAHPVEMVYAYSHCPCMQAAAAGREGARGEWQPPAAEPQDRQRRTGSRLGWAAASAGLHSNYIAVAVQCFDGAPCSALWTCVHSPTGCVAP